MPSSAASSAMRRWLRRKVKPSSAISRSMCLAILCPGDDPADAQADLVPALERPGLAPGCGQAPCRDRARWPGAAPRACARVARREAGCGRRSGARRGSPDDGSRPGRAGRTARVAASPPEASCRIAGARRALIQSSPAGSTSSRMRALVSRPRSAHQDHPGEARSGCAACRSARPGWPDRPCRPRRPRPPPGSPRRCTAGRRRSAPCRACRRGRSRGAPAGSSGPPSRSS